MKAEIRNLGRDFSGYPPATSNYTCTPNQFFEVVLPYSSRGVVRIVGYMIRQILGWSDAAGNPRNSQLSFTYNELIERAGVSRAMLKVSINEAISKNFIKCIREPKSASHGVSAISGLYELKSDDSGVYVDDPGVFSGFYSGEGRFTPTPNTYFDFTLLEEPLSVIKLVGVIIRNTIGFQTKCGFRRTQVALSYQELMAKAGLGRDQLCNAIKLGIQNGHITLVTPGSFSPSPEQRVKATYGVRWTDSAVQNTDQENSGSKTRPEAKQFENPNESGSKTRPRAVRKPDAERYENQTTIKKVQIQEIQQQRETAAVNEVLLTDLINLGFQSAEATEFLNANDEISVRRELKALKLKSGIHNPVGWLVSAVRKEYSKVTDCKKAPVLSQPSRPERKIFDSQEKPSPSYDLKLIRNQFPGHWKQFELKDKVSRTRIMNSSLLPKEILEKVLLAMDLERAQAERFGEFLQKEGILLTKNSVESVGIPYSSTSQRTLG